MKGTVVWVDNQSIYVGESENLIDVRYKLFKYLGYIVNEFYCNGTLLIDCIPLSEFKGEKIETTMDCTPNDYEKVNGEIICKECKRIASDLMFIHTSSCIHSQDKKFKLSISDIEKSESIDKNNSVEINDFFLKSGQLDDMSDKNKSSGCSKKPHEKSYRELKMNENKISNFFDQSTEISLEQKSENMIKNYQILHTPQEKIIKKYSSLKIEKSDFCFKKQKIFKIIHDREYEKDLRPLRFHEVFKKKRNNCFYCETKVKGWNNIKKIQHYFSCLERDITLDPLRRKIKAYSLRKHRRECKKCWRRYNEWENHKCKVDEKVKNLSPDKLEEALASIIPKFQAKTLCLYCDQWQSKIARHDKYCDGHIFFHKNKFRLLEGSEKKLNIFTKRIKKILLSEINEKPVIMHRMSEIKLEKIDENKNIMTDDEFTEAYKKAMKYKRLIGAPWREFPKMRLDLGRTVCLYDSIPNYSYLLK
jgi:hypothetical protein